MTSWAELLLFREAVVSALTIGLTVAVSFVVPEPAATRFVELIHARDLIKGGIYATVFVLGLFLIVYSLERLSSARRTRYISRVFRQDVLYTLFYKAGAFHIFVWAMLAAVLEPSLGFLRLDLVRDLPHPADYAVSAVVGDFVFYWWHRLMHKSSFLWAFHSVHHTQEEMNFATAQRVHPVEMLGYYVILYISVLVVGLPIYTWPPIALAMNIYLGLQHSFFGWGYGKGYYLFVSPRFHRLHHSTDPREYMGNYSGLLSLWDFVFGTGIRTENPPARLGVDGLPVPRTLVAQFMAPFHILLRPRSASAPAALPIARTSHSPSSSSVRQPHEE